KTVDRRGRPPPSRGLHARASARPDRGPVLGVWLDVQAVARPELHVAVVQVEGDRTVEAEQDLVEPVSVPAVGVAGSVAPRSGGRASLGPERLQGGVAPSDRGPGLRRGHLPRVAAARLRRDALAGERHVAEAPPRRRRVVPGLQRTEPRRVDPAREDPRVGVRTLLREVALERADDRAFLVGCEGARELEAAGVAHSGMFPGFRAGTVSRLVESIRSALIRRGRVSAGSITSSMNPRSAAMYGVANLSWYCWISSARAVTGSSA